MGALADAAKRNSKWIIITKGTSVLVTYLEAKLVPNRNDPDLEVAQYKFDTPNGQKYWENGNAKIMVFFDDLPPNSLVKISRDKWIKQDGSEDTSKSSYSVVQVNELGEEIRDNE